MRKSVKIAVAAGVTVAILGPLAYFWQRSLVPSTYDMAEMGYPDFETSQWYGVLAPAGTPRDVVLKLNAEINKALRSAHVTQRYAADNASVSIGTPEEFGAFIHKEQARWEKVVKRSHLKIE